MAIEERGQAAMPQENWQQQHHVDIGALSQRVTGLESIISDIRLAIGDLSKKLDAKPTNWWGIIAGIVALLSLIGTVFLQAMAPVNASLDRHEREIGHIADSAVNRADYLRDREESERWTSSLRDRQRFNEDRGVFKDDLERVERTIARTMDTMAKGIEGSATKTDLANDARRTDERINTIASALHDLQHDFYSARITPVTPSLMK